MHLRRPRAYTAVCEEGSSFRFTIGSTLEENIRKDFRLFFPATVSRFSLFFRSFRRSYAVQHRSARLTTTCTVPESSRGLNRPSRTDVLFTFLGQSTDTKTQRLPGCCFETKLDRRFIREATEIPLTIADWHGQLLQQSTERDLAEFTSNSLSIRRRLRIRVYTSCIRVFCHKSNGGLTIYIVRDTPTFPIERDPIRVHYGRLKGEIFFIINT